MKYSIQSKLGFGYTAGSKAVLDATRILESNGYQIFYINHIRCKYRHVPALLTAICDLIKLTILCLRFKQKDDVVIQWPLYTNDFSIQTLIRILKWKNIRFTILIHDIYHLRYRVADKCSIFKAYTNQANNVIVHSTNMAEHIKSIDCHPQNISILTAFDYLTTDTIPQRRHSFEIAYAGNLTKSVFLNTIDNQLLEKIVLNCYGNGGDCLKPGINYKGRFHPEKVSSLSGSWGLVWDGISSETCSGEYGEYLRYNSPHKISLYIVAGLPVIVWKSSALADYVTYKGLGIIIESLYELPMAISAISNTEYEMMLNNVKMESQKLRSGEHLLNCLVGESNIE